MARTSTYGNGAGIAFIRAHVADDDGPCLTWPLFIDRVNGHGTVSYCGKLYKAHRYMCELAHGAPPTPDHEAAHSCGKGHEGCIHPKHLSWATHSENQLDRRKHGTNKKKGDHKFVVTPEIAAEIRTLYDGKMPIIYIAAKFSISRSTVYYWLRYREELGFGKAA